MAQNDNAGGGTGGTSGGTGSGYGGPGLGGNAAGSGTGGGYGDPGQGTGASGGTGGGYGALSGTGGTGATGYTPGGTGGAAGSTGYTSSTGGVDSRGTDDDFDVGMGYYQRHFERHPSRPATTSWDQARTGYALGHRAASNPAYAGRRFEEIEVEVTPEYEREGGRFEAVREFARHGFEWKKLLGAVAVAAGGWWATRKVHEALSAMSEEDEQDCVVYFEAHPARETVGYDRARSGYALGYAAGRNPDYAGRGWTEVEPHLQSGYMGSGEGDYTAIRDFTRRGYERGSARTGTASTSDTGQVGSSGGATGGGSTGGTPGTSGGLGTGAGDGAF
ncbi:MAG TPA: hypothetical protein VFQ45_14530 [Longimicrobium sp.]|nr:hypothetical protein [Longimicrobium sp.]